MENPVKSKSYGVFFFRNIWFKNPVGPSFWVAVLSLEFLTTHLMTNQPRI